MKHVETIELMSFHYRLFHTLNLVLFLTLAFTGVLIMYTDDYTFLQILVKPLGEPLASLQGLDPEIYAVSTSLALMRLIHRLIAVIWGVVIIFYILFLLVTRNIRVFDGLLRSPSVVLEEAKAVLLHYTIGKPIPEEVEVKMERHNVMVGMAVILLIIGAGLLMISGTLMVFSGYLGITSDQYRVLLMLHDIGFYLSMLFLVGHLFAVLHPSNLPLLVAMFGDGRVSIEYAKKHMHAYLKKIKAI
ncbi:MAG: cytochrome b/b6 domain-containing protein [Acidilobaceae archaeon]